MAHIRRLIIGKTLTDPALSVLCHVVVSNTLNDKAFSLVRTATLKVYTALAAYDKALLKAQEAPSPARTLAKNEARTVLRVALKGEMNAINFHYAGDTELMMASGFEINQDQRRYIDINQPATNLSVFSRQPERVKWSCDRVLNANVIVRYRIVGSGNTYQMMFSNKSSGVIRDLESGKKYEFEAVNVSKREQDDVAGYRWCQEKVWIVQ